MTLVHYSRTLNWPAFWKFKPCYLYFPTSVPQVLKNTKLSCYFLYHSSQCEPWLDPKSTDTWGGREPTALPTRLTSMCLCLFLFDSIESVTQKRVFCYHGRFPLPVDSCQRCCSVTGSAELAGVALAQAELLKLGSELHWLPQRHLAFLSGQEIRLFTPVTFSLNEQTCCCPLVLTELQLHVPPEDNLVLQEPNPSFQPWSGVSVEEALSRVWSALKLRSSCSSKRALPLPAHGFLLQNDADGPDDAHQLNHVTILKKGNVVIMAGYTASSETKNKPFKATLKGCEVWIGFCVVLLCICLYTLICMYSQG